MDTIEFYDGDSRHPMAVMQSSMVPPIGAKISIRKKTWEVMAVTFALDHLDEPVERAMRANVSLRAAQSPGNS